MNGDANRKGTKSMNKTQARQSNRSVWERILALLEEDLAERRRKSNRKTFVEVSGESGSCRKEIGELVSAELRSLEPGLRERVAEQLLDRHLAGKGRIDLLDGKHPYTKDIRDLTPEDLPALIRADWEKAEAYRDKHEREEFIRKVQEDLNGLCVTELRRCGDEAKAKQMAHGKIVRSG